MPEAADYSAVAAILTMWLAARAEGIGMGWISILTPSRVAAILSVPNEWRFIGYLCIGYPAQDSEQPELEREGWETRKPAATFVIRR
jgi:5,6-dimethylbenzimidazole synthase